MACLTAVWRELITRGTCDRCVAGTRARWHDGTFNRCVFKAKIGIACNFDSSAVGRYH